MKAALRRAVLAAVLIPATAGAGKPTRKYIDDFSDGALHQAFPATATTSYQLAPTALGHVRQTTLVSTDTAGLPSTIDIGSQQLSVSSGLGSFMGLYLGYGYDTDGGAGGLHENFSGCDRLRIDFAASDLELGYALQVYDGQGAVATLDGDVSTAGQLGYFSAVFPMNQFHGHDADGNPRDIDWHDITYVIALFQSGSAIGGNDFAVEAILALGDSGCAQ